MTKKQEPQIKKVCKRCLKFGDTKGIVVCDDKFTVNCPAWPPQPATCPDCDDPIAQHDSDGCHAEPIAGGICDCKRTPADLHQGDTVYTSLGKGVVVQPEPKCNASFCNSKMNGYCTIPNECGFKVKPEPEMPLARCAKGFTIRCSICEEIKPDDDGRCVYLQTQQAHDQQVASKAVKEFAEKVIATMPNFSKEGDWSHIITENEKLLAEILRIGARYQYNKSVAHIRAMAGGKE